MNCFGFGAIAGAIDLIFIVNCEILPGGEGPRIELHFLFKLKMCAIQLTSPLMISCTQHCRGEYYS